MTTRSNRNTGEYRSRRGSGPVGWIPPKKPGNPAKERRKTKPLAKGKHTGPHYHAKVMRGRKKVMALIERAWTPTTRMNRLTAAVKGALGKLR